MFTRLQLMEVIENIQKEKQDALTKIQPLISCVGIALDSESLLLIQQTYIVETCDRHIKMLQKLLDSQNCNYG